MKKAVTKTVTWLKAPAKPAPHWVSVLVFAISGLQSHLQTKKRLETEKRIKSLEKDRDAALDAALAEPFSKGIATPRHTADCPKRDVPLDGKPCYYCG